jgi:hypothetical protein
MNQKNEFRQERDKGKISLKADEEKHTMEKKTNRENECQAE